MKDDNCTICGKPLNGMMVGTGEGGAAHSVCYERQHLPRTAVNLWEVLRGEDPILAANVVEEIVPAEIALKIVREYNKRLLKQWLRACLRE